MSKRFTRQSFGYRDLSHCFSVEHNYGEQFDLIYKMRRIEMVTLMKAHQPPLPEATMIGLLHGLRGSVCVMGIVIKTMKKSPQILDIDDLLVVEDSFNSNKMFDELDKIYVEDESGRIELSGAIDVSKLVTGLVLAFIGKVESTMKSFIVESVVHCPVAPQPMFIWRYARPKHILFVSDLGVSIDMQDADVSKFKKLIQFVRGTMEGLSEKGIENCSNIARVIIAGNIIPRVPVTMGGTDEEIESDMNGIVDSMKVFDGIINQLGESIEIDIMAGENEVNLSRASMPQTPISPIYFPESRKLKTVRCVTNPYLASFDDVIVLGTSGQGVKSVFKQTSYTDFVSCMEAMLKWRHILPSAPDSIPCLPFTKTDPFVIRSLPHVFFSAGYKEFHVKKVKLNGTEVTTFSIPSFHETSTVVLMNMSNLKTTAFKIE